MRHRVQGRKLGRTSAHRRAMFRNQLTSLFQHERITTTVAKAKELRPLAEKMVTLARTGTVHARRQVRVMVPDRSVVRRLFDEIAPRFMDRDGGYTRIVRIGQRRGDGAELAILEFVDFELSAGKDSSGERGEQRTSFMDRARNMFGARPKSDESTATEPDEPVEESAAASDDEPEAEAAVTSTDAEDVAPAAVDEPEADAEATSSSAEGDVPTEDEKK